MTIPKTAIEVNEFETAKEFVERKLLLAGFHKYGSVAKRRFLYTTP